jgi:hypothetical protein
MTSGESRVVKGISRDSGNGSTRIEAIGLAARSAKRWQVRVPNDHRRNSALVARATDVAVVPVAKQRQRTANSSYEPH